MTGGATMRWLGGAPVQLGQVEAQCGQSDAARVHLADSLAIAKQIKNAEAEGEGELVLGEVAMEAGNEAEAERRFQRSLSVCSTAGDRRGAAHACWALGRLDLRAGRLTAAQARLREALFAFDGFEMRAPWVGCLEDHAALALALGDAPLACGLAAAGQRLRDSAHLARSPQMHARWNEMVERLRSALGAVAFDTEWAAASEWDPDEMRKRALGLNAAAGST